MDNDDDDEGDSDEDVDAGWGDGEAWKGLDFSPLLGALASVTRVTCF